MSRPDTRGGGVVVGLSGGVDSAVAASLLKKQGYRVCGVIGIFTDMGMEDVQLEKARSVANTLGVKLIERDMRGQFREIVVNYFLSEYARGCTPSPCIICNRRIKFPILDDVRKELNYEFIATGHYARTSTGNKLLMRGKGIDQSYFLSRVDQGMLKRTVLPLGDMNKEDVKKKSIEIFNDTDWHSSQDICFVHQDYADLVRERYPETGEPGPIENTSGERIGTHHGIAHYTVGQRRRIQTSLSVPLYVKRIIPMENLLIVGTREECLDNSLLATAPIWLIPPENGRVYNVQTYSTQIPFEAKLLLEEEQFRLDFLKSQFQITPGQLAVLYDEEYVVGSGWIQGTG